MKKFAILAAAPIALFGAQAAQAQTYTPGTHTFSGPMAVEKDSGSFDCTLNLTIDATSSSATATASLDGAFPCTFIAVTGTGTVSVSGSNVTISGLTITPPLSPGQCTGPITVVWGGNSASPRTLTASSPLSNSTATSGADCQLNGVVSQTSTPALDIT